MSTACGPGFFTMVAVSSVLFSQFVLPAERTTFVGIGIGIGLWFLAVILWLTYSDAYAQQIKPP